MDRLLRGDLLGPPFAYSALFTFGGSLFPAVLYFRRFFIFSSSLFPLSYSYLLIVALSSRPYYCAT